MDKREPRPGYVNVSLQLPRKVADLLAERGDDFISIIELLGRECQHLPPTAEVRADAERLREQEKQKRQEETEKRGRLSYRLFRRYGGGKHIAIRPDLLNRIALELGANPKLIELNIGWFKQSLEAKVRKRRGREIERYYWAGKSNYEIADRLGVHRNTVVKYIREVIKPTGRRS